MFSIGKQKKCHEQICCCECTGFITLSLESTENGNLRRLYIISLLWIVLISQKIRCGMNMCVHIHVPVCVYFGVIDGKMSEDKKWISIPSVWIRKSRAWLLNSSCTEQRHERSQPCSQSNTNVQDLAPSPKAEDLKAHVCAICHFSDTTGALHIIQISDLRMDNLKDTKVHNMDNSQSFHQCQHENILSEF